MSFSVDIQSFFNNDSAKFNSERWEYTPEGVSDFIDTREFLIKALRNTKLPKDFTCLDLGSGAGIWESIVRDEGCKTYTAVDISSQMLEYNPADHKYCHNISHGFPKELKGNKYDVILAVHSLEYIKNLSVLMDDCRQALTPNGIIIVVTKNKDALVWRWMKQIVDTFASEKLLQFWRKPSDFIGNNLNIQAYPLDVRFPTMLNNVNDTYRFKGNGGRYRQFIHKRINPLLRYIKSTKNPFAWHLGIILSHQTKP